MNIKQKRADLILPFWKKVTHKLPDWQHDIVGDIDSFEDVTLQQGILKDGLALFEKLHGRKASFFVSTNRPLNHKIEQTAADAGIKYISSSKILHEVLDNGKTKKYFRYLGKLNTQRQLFHNRNAFFEPNSNRKTDWIGACLQEIESVFKFKKPATMSSHRVNYIGEHDIINRTKSLTQLSKLLKRITTNWPDVEFMSSSALGSLINNSR